MDIDYEGHALEITSTTTINDARLVKEVNYERVTRIKCYWYHRCVKMSVRTNYNEREKRIAFTQV